jgi:hypothetical protein
MNPATADTTGTKQKKQNTLDRRVRPELNLDKWPIFRPAKSKNPLRPRILQREITLPDGRTINAKVEIAPTTRGELTTEDQKTLYALVKHWEEKGKPETLTFFSIKGLARLLKKKWGSNVIQALTESLIRLRITAFIWENSYYDKTSGAAVEVLDPFNILSDLKIIKRKQDGHITKEAGYFRFNDYMLNNLLANNTRPVLFDVVISFKSEVAQLLYVYLDVLMADKTLYERRTKELFEDLGLEGKSYRSPANRKQVLERALKELQGVEVHSGKFTTAKLEETKDGKDYKIVIRKGPAAPAALDQPAEEAGSKEAPAKPLKDQLTMQGAELVKYFYRVFQGNDKTTITTKAIGQAVSMIAQVGFDKAKYVVEFAKRAAAETNFNIQHFGGILNYQARALEEYDEHQRQQESRARRQAEEAEKDRLESEYAQYRTGRLDAHIAEQQVDLAPLIEAKKQSILQEHPRLKTVWSDQQLTEHAARQVRSNLAKEIGVESWEEFYDRNRSTEELQAEKRRELEDGPTLQTSGKLDS